MMKDDEDIWVYTRPELEEVVNMNHAEYDHPYDYNPGIEDHALLGMKEWHRLCIINYTTSEWEYIDHLEYRDEILTQLGIKN
jgi:hypothetical protein